MQKKINDIVILQLGAGNLLSKTINILKDEGFRVYAVDKDPNAYGFGLSDGYEVIDISNTEGIVEYAKTISADLIIAVNEAGVLPASIASERLGLPNIPSNIAARFIHKGLMRRCLDKQIRQPSFKVINRKEEIEFAFENSNTPLVLKPCIGWGSNGVSIITSKEDIDFAWEFAFKSNRSEDFIIEEYIEGTEFTIEGIVVNGIVYILAKSDKEHQKHDKYCVAMSLNYPAKASQEILDKIDFTVKKTISILGLKKGAFHCECIVKDNHVYLIEIGARGGGGHIFHTIVEVVSGICMPKELVKIFLNKDYSCLYEINQRGCCYKFFNAPNGIFKSIYGIENAKKMPGIIDIGFLMKPGTVVTAISGDASRPGYCVAEGATREDAINNANKAILSLEFKMEKI